MSLSEAEIKAILQAKWPCRQKRYLRKSKLRARYRNADLQPIIDNLTEKLELLRELQAERS